MENYEGLTLVLYHDNREYLNRDPVDDWWLFGNESDAVDFANKLREKKGCSTPEEDQYHWVSVEYPRILDKNYIDKYFK